MRVRKRESSRFTAANMTFYIAIESAQFLENNESNVASFAVVIFNFVMVLVFFSSSVCVSLLWCVATR